MLFTISFFSINQNNMSKQLCINQLPLCDDVLNIIKSYCFYDNQTLCIQKLKPIVERFQTAVFSRFRPNNAYDTDNNNSDNCEHWMTNLSYVYNRGRIYEILIDEILFQEANCRICGGFMSPIKHYSKPKQVIPENIKCKGGCTHP